MTASEGGQGELQLIMQIYRGLPVGQLPKEVLAWLRRADAVFAGAREESGLIVRDAMVAAAAVHASFQAARRLGSAALRQRAARSAAQCADRLRRVPRGRG